MTAVRARSFAALALALAAACAGTRAGGAGAPHPDLARAEQALARGDVAGARAALERVPARERARSPRAGALEAAVARAEVAPFEAAFSELAAALADRDDAVARRVVDRVLALGPRGAALARAQAFERVVRGRETIAGLALRLEVAPAEPAGTYEIALEVASALREPVEIECPASSLTYLAIGVEPSGIEQRSARRTATDALARLRIEPGGEVRLPLGRVQIVVAGLVAARGRFELEVAPGMLERAGERLPAGRVDVEPCEVVRLDPRIPPGAVEPEELARYVERGAPSIAALLERAVRVEPGRRAESLARIAPLCAIFPDADLERVVPALRWLSGRRDLQGAAAWRRFLSTQAAGAAGSANGGSSAR